MLVKPLTVKSCAIILQILESCIMHVPLCKNLFSQLKSLLPVRITGETKLVVFYSGGTCYYSRDTVTVPLVFYHLEVITSPLHPPPHYCLSPLLLSVLISRRSPAHGILFALGQDKHCSCVTPKTFHRLSRFQHGPDISVIGFFLLWECLRG